MSDLVDRITAVLAAHRGYQATTAQSTWVCSRACGWEGDTNGGRSQWEAHVAERVAAELQLTEERRTNPMSSAGWSKNWKTGEVTTHSDIRYLRRWVSAWSEVQP